MAFTDAQKAQIRALLGYPDGVDATVNNLDAAMGRIGAEAEIQIETRLTDIGAIETDLRSTLGRQGIVRAEDIYWNPSGGATANLRSERRRYIREIAAILGVAVLSGGGGGMGPLGRG